MDKLNNYDNNFRPGVVGLIIALANIFLLAMTWQFAQHSIFYIAVPAAAMSLFATLFVIFFLVLRKKYQKSLINDEILASKYQGKSDLFGSSASVDKESFISFCNLTTPVISTIAGVLVIALAWLLWAKVSTDLPDKMANLKVVAVAFLPFLVNLFAGSYYSGLAKEKGLAWFRPVANWFKFSAFTISLIILTFISYGFQDLEIDITATVIKIAAIVTALVGADLILSVILQFYQTSSDPNNCPAYESKLLTIFSSPSEITKNIANLLNYQFGYEISESSFFRTLEHGLLPFVLVTVVIGWLMTAVVYIPEDSQGIRECFGKVSSTTPLQPGIYFKLPYPFAEIKKKAVKKVNDLTLGHLENVTTDPHVIISDEVIEWGNNHANDEENYILPTQQSHSNTSVPGSYLTVSFKVSYVIKDLYKYLYQFKDADKLLYQLSQAEVLRFLSGSEFFKFLNEQRTESADEIQRLIQGKADRYDLGVEIIYVGFPAAHPPVSVGRDFEKVTSSLEHREATILQAEAYANRILPETSGKAFALVEAAKTYRDKVTLVAYAESKQFLEKHKSHLAFKDYFELDNQLKALENSAKRRKYIVSKSFKKYNYTLNLEENLTPSLLDLNNEVGE